MMMDRLLDMEIKLMRPFEKNKRSIVKSITYRVISIAADATVAYLFTHSVALSAGIVIFVDTYSTILYFIHERFWAHIEWGRHPA